MAGIEAIVAAIAQEADESALERAKDELRSLEPDAYFPMLLQLVGRYATSGTGTLLLSAADEARMPPDFEERANALVRERGGSLKVEGVDEDLGGGFILRYGLVDVSCTLDALFAERADELRDRVAQLLFQE